MATLAIRDVKLGRLALPTIDGDLKEQVGDQLDVAGGSIVAGERRPRSYQFILPLRGSPGEADPFLAGERMRRQMRALMENTIARLQGLYFKFSPDPEQNSWMMVGGGSIDYAEGGITLADFQFEFSDAYRIANVRTHRAARRLELYDRTLSTTPRDVLGVSFGTDFAGLLNYKLPLHYLPVGATDLLGVNRRVVTPGYRVAANGSIVVVPNAQAAEVVSFEQAESAMHGADDVVVYDRRSKGDPPAGFAALMMGERPTAYYRFNEQPGAATLVDSGRNHLNGTYMNGPVLGAAGLTGDGDTAASLTTNNYARTVDLNNQLAITGDLSIIYGYKPDPTAWINLLKNTSFEVDLTNWNASGSQPGQTRTRVTTWAKDGTASMRLQASASTGSGQTAGTMTPFTDVPVVPGDTVAMRANVRNDGTTQINMRPRWIAADGVTVVAYGTDQIFGGTGEAVLSGTWVAPATTAYVALEVYAVSTATAQVYDWYLDSVLLAKAATVPAYTTGYGAIEGLMSKAAAGAGNGAYRFGVDKTTGEMIFEASGDGTARTLARSSGAAITVSQPYLLAAVYNAAAGSVTFYRNGVALNTVTGLPTALFANARLLTQGKWEAD